jgi:7-cyano-7-deazaguanine reductase
VFTFAGRVALLPAVVLVRSYLIATESPLGQPSPAASTYTPSLLFSIRRTESREDMGITDPLPFLGEDLWTGYEFSWLDGRGMPRVAGLRVWAPCTSDNLVESKSMKLYLNSFAQTRFWHRNDVINTLESDLNLAFRSPVAVELIDLYQLATVGSQFPGQSLDHENITTDVYERNVDLLEVADTNRAVRETLYSDLFRSLCPVTGQPDWASIMVEYAGPPIDRAGLLKYFISYRNHQAFHEATVEQIYMDIMALCKPQTLSVYGRFLRRGGLDINPFRSNVTARAPVLRLPRQ